MNIRLLWTIVYALLPFTVGVVVLYSYWFHVSLENVWIVGAGIWALDAAVLRLRLYNET